MSVVVCDASPLIFLAKLDRLELIRGILGGEVVVLRCVVDEVLGADGSFWCERERLGGFLEGVHVVDFDETMQASGRLSASDARTLAYAVSEQVDWLVADEKLLRRIAAHEGIATIGTLGLLVGAARLGLLTSKEAMDDVDAAITTHHLRISLPLYREIQGELMG